MSEAFIGEIRLAGFGFAPRGWAACDGQVLPISQNTALFSLLGTYYGGDGRTTFALPNLQASAPVGTGQAPGLSPRAIGERGGAPSVTLSAAQIPAHSHIPAASTSVGSQDGPGGGVWAVPGGARGEQMYATALGSGVAMSAAAIGAAGSGQPHDNLPPYTAVNFIICMQGVYPQRP